MSDYTPSTDEMRWVYVRADRAALSREEYEAEFDRWLAKRDAEVAAKAWEEGVDATCAAYSIVRTRGYVTNPYREEVES